MWWEILKRQVASTKGKTFQLDFNQPMIEEEEDECRKKFIAMAQKVEQMTMGGTRNTKYERQYEKRYDIKNNFESTHPYIFGSANFKIKVYLEDVEKIPENVFCVAIKEFELFDNGDRDDFKIDGYDISVLKKHILKRDYFAIESSITISKGPFDEICYFDIEFVADYPELHAGKTKENTETELARLVTLYEEEVNKL
jgi:hypothetical protein